MSEYKHKYTLEIGDTIIKDNVSITPVKINGEEKEVSISPYIYGTERKIVTHIVEELLKTRTDGGSN